VPGAGAEAEVGAPGHAHDCVFIFQRSGSRLDEERLGCAGTKLNRKQGVAPTWKGAVNSDLPSQLVFTCRAAAQPSAVCRLWRARAAPCTAVQAWLPRRTTVRPFARITDATQCAPSGRIAFVRAEHASQVRTKQASLSSKRHTSSSEADGLPRAAEPPGAPG